MGQAGAGKDALMQAYVKDHSNEIHEIISCTTRPKRDNEQDKVNYFFLSNEEFAEKVLKDEMLECTIFNDWCYGTSYNALDEDKVNIGVFNPAGIEALLTHSNIEVYPIYVVASDKTRLIRQLTREDNPDIDEIFRRFKADRLDFSDIDFCYARLTNENKLEDALHRLTTYIDAVRTKKNNS